MQIPSYAYLGLLGFSLAALVALDFRRKLALFIRPRSSAKIIALCVGLFLAWDVAGILLGIFQTNPDFVVGLHILTPNLPIEELLLLTLISYLALITTNLLEGDRK